jgi:hypothetical protein
MEADLFTPQDAAALSSIRADNARRAMTLAELFDAFDARGLLGETAAAPARLPRQTGEARR